jgi:hypothetical protein
MEEIEIEKELIDMLNDGCYGVLLYKDGFLPADCTLALRSDNAVVLLIISADRIRIFVVYITPSDSVIREYSRIEDAVRDIKRLYGEEVVIELLRRALYPQYNTDMLKARLEEIFEEQD